MREIKFRAWDKKNGCWSKIQEWSEAGVNATIYDHRETPNLELTSDDYYEWSQFTGLKDSEGKEIYEGDILQNNEVLGEVKWIDRDSSFKLVIPRTDKFPEVRSNVTTFSEVIGNIYENPELLK